MRAVVVGDKQTMEGRAVIKTKENDEWMGIEAYCVETEEFGCFEI